LLAELALRAREARHAPVQPVEDHGDEDRDTGALEVAVDRRNDGIEAGKQRSRREQVREQVDAAAKGKAGAGLFHIAACGRAPAGTITRRSGQTVRYDPVQTASRIPMRLSQLPINTLKEVP